MNSTNFVPMYDLEHLDENQRASYYKDACDLLGIPANLNLLAYISMTVGDTGRHLVLYAKKGATDLIRQNRGISTTALEAIKDLVPGQVCFVAVGRDKENREERAIGTASIEGLRGKDLSDAIMIAQTRATRRMTLQFVGGGVLDESELPSNTTSLTNSNAALDAIITQPVVVPNSTPSVVEPPALEEMRHPALASFENPAGLRGVNDFLTIKKYEVEPTPAQKEAQAALASVKPEALVVAAGESFKTVADLAKSLPADNPLAQIAAVEPPKQRKRKQAPQDAPVPETAQDPQAAEFAKAAEALLAAAHAVISAPVQTPQQNLPAQPVQPPVVEKLLNPEQEKEVKERLAKYRNEILPMGGMVPVDKIGGVEVQLRTFVGKFNPEKKSSKLWNFQDWNKFLDFFDDIVKIHKAEGLVKYIQQAIGIIK